MGKKTGQVWVDFAKTWARLSRLGLGEHLGNALSGGLELPAVGETLHQTPLVLRPRTQVRIDFLKICGDSNNLIRCHNASCRG